MLPYCPIGIVVIGIVALFRIVILHPFLITIVFVCFIGIGVDNVLREHQFRLIDLKVRHVLAIVGLGCCLLFFIV